ncbi:TetR/AcrR family transcriptional regulator [Actinomadura madurae]|uniref:TetR/AcrR family transcriptional regulator n=1 Tax=Actinomadura madurae TaxID=1993 RepID=UPI0020273295|nr:TetR/AcrR family transcriptional regulator [Actinomadura madurae]MCP9953082.1 TetR/AcrR family transcriptional regulator [Actinomadura madurae]MCP9969848.1 TetR/AcrR family transcriptional regulator [Actinomadura madurae]MCP9982302.1 TetR/AcrR family transcriptional regulator [Actinomadura madurae]MCQ0006170.1 TetR/AcrR family transcriptional regulator [Actinomadura madurae]MCQ0018546.1 TetR/AcrR family transcriptional regulator [Actinomadura madurae]
MSDTLDAMPSRPRRSDARRSIDAILDAARVVLGERPDASMEEVAARANVTRQTVYAHFPSRDALVAALVETAAAEYSALLDAAGLDTAPPADALAGFLDAGWRFLRRHPLILDPTLTRVPRPKANDPHDVVPPRLERLIQRGQQANAFDRSLPASWLAAAVIGLQHAAAAEIADARLTPDEASALCLESALRLCGATPTH